MAHQLGISRYRKRFPATRALMITTRWLTNAPPVERWTLLCDAKATITTINCCSNTRITHSRYTNILLAHSTQTCIRGSGFAQLYRETAGYVIKDLRATQLEMGGDGRSILERAREWNISSQFIFILSAAGEAQTAAEITRAIKRDPQLLSRAHRASNLSDTRHSPRAPKDYNIE